MAVFVCVMWIGRRIYVNIDLYLLFVFSLQWSFGNLIPKTLGNLYLARVG